MRRVLIISYSALSDLDANGKTLKALFFKFNPSDLFQFCSGKNPTDLKCCQHSYRVDDKDLITSFIKNKNLYHCCNIFGFDEQKKQKKIVNNATINKDNNAQSFLFKFLIKHKYNYFLRLIRELLFLFSPWGKKNLYKHLKIFKPDIIFYMVGESFAFDLIVLKIYKKLNIPLIIYNAEGYRLVDSKKRILFDRFFCYLANKYYREILKKSDYIIYNSPFLKDEYNTKYAEGTDKKNCIIYNSNALNSCEEYSQTDDILRILYFGNLGVGRFDTLIEFSSALVQIDPKIEIHVFSNLEQGKIDQISKYNNIYYHGFASEDVLVKNATNSDILLHLESFDKAIMPKLRYAFSTKIAQYLTYGRCIISYAPKDMASSHYLLEHDAAYLITNPGELKQKLLMILNHREIILKYAFKARKIAAENHNCEKNSSSLLNIINNLIL